MGRATTTTSSAAVVCLLAALLAAASALGAHAPAQPAAAGAPPAARQAVTDADFGILLALLNLTGLDAAVAAGNLTVFAPNDDAFVATVASLGLGLVEKDGVVAALAAALEGLGLDVVETVESVLLYHVVGEPLLAADVLAKTELTTLLGEAVMRGGDGMSATQLGDAATSVRDPEIVATDVEEGGNVFHVIDRVLLPSPIATLLELFVDEDAGVAPKASGTGCEACAEGELCTATPWEEKTEAACLPAPPPCYLSGARNKGADGETFVPYAPCCSGNESVEAPVLGYGSWCLP